MGAGDHDFPLPLGHTQSLGAVGTAEVAVGFVLVGGHMLVDFIQKWGGSL